MPDAAPAGAVRGRAYVRGAPPTSISPPASVRTIGAVPDGATRLVLVRHGEAVCNVKGVVGGVKGCTGLSERGVVQVEALAARLRRSGELAGVDALYSSILPRARETAELLVPALDAWRDAPALWITEECGLCELHPGEADGLDWGEFSERFDPPDWDVNPDVALAPGAESWSAFVRRASAAVAALAVRHPGGLVVVACHAGVIEATMATFLPLAHDAGRLRLRTDHASMTEWEHFDGRWLLRRYNDVTAVPSL